MGYIMIMVIGYYLMRSLVQLIVKLKKRLPYYVKKYRKQGDLQNIYDRDFIDSKVLFNKLFKKVPNRYFIKQLDAVKTFGFINDANVGEIASIYQNSYFNWNENKGFAETTIFRLKKGMLIEVGNNYAEIFYASEDAYKINEMVEALLKLKAEEKLKANEMNIVTLDNGYLELKPLTINPVELDLNLYYNDDFIEVDAFIKERLSREKDKGIVLLHGLPGTGKTTYLRHLIGSLNKKVLFVSPAATNSFMNPDFIDLLIDNPNSILVIEDAESVIMDRKYDSGSGVSNLLNISDGLMSDVLNVQLVCTFNSSIQMVDQALLRKGRLIAKYEFGKLAIDKAQALSKHLGNDVLINKPMSIAEIANPDALSYETDHLNIIGFKRNEVLTN